MIVKRFSTFLETLLWPHTCAACGIKLESGALCERCRAKFEVLPWIFCSRCERRLAAGSLCQNAGHRTPLRGIGIVLRYDVPCVKRTLWAYKYKGRKDLAEEFAKMAIRYADQELTGRIAACSPMVIPIPLHYRRERQRGFNQAALIAEPFGRNYGYEYRDDLLRRTANRPPQAKIKEAKKRLENITGVFECHPSPELRGRTIILIDDVASSGATLEEAARTLKGAGCRDVWGLVIARGQ